TATLIGTACFARGTHGNAVQPGRHRLPPVFRAGPAGQDEKGGLVSVFGIVIVAEDALADAQHYGAVAIHEDTEGRFVVLAGELSQQVAVAHLAELLQRCHPPDLIQQEILAVWSIHRVHLVFVRGFSLYLFPTRQKKAQTVFHEEAVKAITTCGRHGSTPWRTSPAEVEI